MGRSDDSKWGSGSSWRATRGDWIVSRRPVKQWERSGWYCWRCGFDNWWGRVACLQCSGGTGSTTDRSTHHSEASKIDDKSGDEEKKQVAESTAAARAMLVAAKKTGGAEAVVFAEKLLQRFGVTNQGAGSGNAVPTSTTLRNAEHRLKLCEKQLCQAQDALEYRQAKVAEAQEHEAECSSKVAAAKEKVEGIKAHMACEAGVWSAPKTSLSSVADKLAFVLSQDQLGKGFAAGNGDTVMEGVTGILEELRAAINGLPGDDPAHKREERLQNGVRSRRRLAAQRYGTESRGEGGTCNSADGGDIVSGDMLDDDDETLLAPNASAGPPFRKSIAAERADYGGGAQRAAFSGAKGSYAKSRKKKK